jgi:hypothetical protein
MSGPTNRHSHLWNDLPDSERKRLHPFLIESQILHLWQAKQAAIAAHRRHMMRINSVIKNLKSELEKSE